MPVKPLYLPTLTHTRVWYLADATNVVLGRMASQIALILMGKRKPVYHPTEDCGDFVVVINGKKVALTGKKRLQKVYRYHSGWVGGLKEIPFEEMIEKKPEEVILRAVSGMLPKNNLREDRLSRLKVFPDENHPYVANITEKLIFPQRQDTLRILPKERREMNEGFDLVEKLKQEGLKGLNKEGIPLVDWTKLQAQKKKKMKL